MIFIVEAFGGSWEDAWTRSVCACTSQSKADEIIANLESWLPELRSMELPESLEMHNFDEEDDEDMLRYDIALSEFKDQVLFDMKVPEELHEWLLENWDYSHDCDYPGYRVQEVPVI